jgi:Amt family ammonium transporter
MTAILAKIVDVIPFLGLRASEQGEIIGMDDDQIGEFVQDFVEVRRDFDSWHAPGGGKTEGLHQRGHEVAAGDRHGVPDHSVRDEPRAPYAPDTSNGSHNEKTD